MSVMAKAVVVVMMTIIAAIVEHQLLGSLLSSVFSGCAIFATKLSGASAAIVALHIFDEMCISLR